jgi:hypothetical protein
MGQGDWPQTTAEVVGKISPKSYGFAWYQRTALDNGGQKYGGGGGIRTPGELAPSTVFKTAAIDHSATPPQGRTSRSRLPLPCRLSKASLSAAASSRSSDPANPGSPSSRRNVNGTGLCRLPIRAPFSRRHPASSHEAVVPFGRRAPDCGRRAPGNR